MITYDEEDPVFLFLCKSFQCFKDGSMGMVDQSEFSQGNFAGDVPGIGCGIVHDIRTFQEVKSIAIEDQIYRSIFVAKRVDKFAKSLITDKVVSERPAAHLYISEDDYFFRGKILLIFCAPKIFNFFVFHGLVFFFNFFVAILLLCNASAKSGSSSIALS